MDWEEDDLPIGFPKIWDAIVDALRTFGVQSRGLGGARKDPEAPARKKAREKTAKWKEQHRRHARESARRKRAERRAKLQSVPVRPRR